MGTIGRTAEEVDPASTRLIGDSDHATAWVAVDHRGDICLIVLLPNGVNGAGCNPPSEFERSGAGVSVSGGAPDGPHASAAAYLLPSDVPESSLRDAADQIRQATRDHSGWIETSYRDSIPLIVLSRNFAVDAGSVTIDRSDGTPFTLHMR